MPFRVGAIAMPLSSSSLMPLPIPRMTVTASAVAHLREAIVLGQLGPGEPLPEARIGEQLGVSRAPIREALTLLERKGLVRFDHRGTARVSEFTVEDIRELGLMRVALEPLATRLACERFTPELEETLLANLEETQSAESLPEVTRLDVEFHRILFQASGHQRLLNSWEALAPQIRLVMGRYHRRIESRTQKTRDLTHKNHLPLLAAVKSGDPAAAERVAHDHANSWFKYWDAPASETPIVTRAD
jgi:DNA-binding GntR family transcriptional regulator